MHKCVDIEEMLIQSNCKNIVNHLDIVACEALHTLSVQVKVSCMSSRDFAQ